MCVSVCVCVCATATAKSLQSCPTLWDPMDGSPPSLGFSRQEHWSGLPFLLQCMKVKSESEVAQSWPHGLQPTRLLRPWDFPGKSTRVGCYIYICIYIYTYHIFSIHSSINGHLGCFHVLVIQIVLLWTLGYIYLFELWFYLDISHHFMENRRENSGNSDRLYLGGFKNHSGWWLQPWN